MKYTLAGLCNVDFDKSYKNTRYFQNNNDRDNYYNDLVINHGSNFSEYITNLPLNDIITTTIVFNLSGNLKINLNYNYCVFKGDEGYLYFFINKINYINDKQIKVFLEIDALTNYINEIELINTNYLYGHRDRFLKNELDNTYYFNFLHCKYNSDVAPLKFVKNSEKLYPFYRNANTTLKDFVKNNVLAWKYYYVSIDETSEISWLNYTISNLVKSYIVLCAPIYKNRYKIDSGTGAGTYNTIYVNFPNSNGAKEWTDENLKKYLLNTKLDVSSTPTLFDNVIMSKISPLSPFENHPRQLNTVNINLNINLNQLSINLIDNSYLYNTYFLLGGKQTYIAPVVVYQGSNNDKIHNINLQNLARQKFNNFTLDEIQNNSNNQNMEPFIYNSAYTQLRLLSPNGEYFDYDFTRISIKDNYNIVFFESYSPPITNIYSYIDDIDDYYSPNNLQNGNLLVTNWNNTDIITTNQKREFLANNIGFYQNLQETYDLAKNSNQVQHYYNLVAGFSQGGAEAVAGAYTGNGEAVSSGLSKTNPLGIIGGEISNYYTNKKMDLTNSIALRNVDNLAFNRAVIKNNSNDYLQLINMDFYNFKIAVMQCDTLIIEQLHKRLIKYGYPLNLNDINFFDFITSRKYYNYVECNVEIIKGNVSNVIKNMIKTILLNGVTFWHNEIKPHLEYNNYERSL